MTTDDRIATIDIVRGVAVCGILLMNITGMAMPEAAYENPRAWGGSDGVNLVVWAINFVAIDGKMRGLFSFLFGASLLIVTDRADANGESPARVHYRRMLWLFLIGLAHLWLVWWGDILHHYAMVGALAFLLRKLSIRLMSTLAVALILLQTAAYLPFVATISRAETMLATHPQDPESIKTLDGLRDLMGVPNARDLARDIATHRAGYQVILADRWKETRNTPRDIFLGAGMETLAYMLLGMVGLRTGLLTGAWSARRYAVIAASCFAISVPGYVALAWIDVASGFDMAAVALGSLAASAPLRPIMIIGWACLIALLARPGGWLASRFAAAGRMAFTNYLASSLICTTIFYGYGLGWYGALHRAELLPIVAGVWGLMLAWSEPWLRRFQYGPAEWIWRSLARGQLQPLQRAAVQP